MGAPVFIIDMAESVFDVAVDLVSKDTTVKVSFKLFLFCANFYSNQIEDVFSRPVANVELETINAVYHGKPLI